MQVIVILNQKFRLDCSKLGKEIMALTLNVSSIWTNPLLLETGIRIGFQLFTCQKITHYFATLIEFLMEKKGDKIDHLQENSLVITP